MKILCVGSTVPVEYETLIPNFSNASNRFLFHLFNALKTRGQQIVQISYLGVPVEDTIKEELLRRNGLPEEVRYILKSQRLAGGIWDCHRQMAKKLRECDCLLAYNVVYGWIFAPFIARRLHKRSILVLADFSDVDAINGFTKKMYARLQRFMIRRFDIVIGLSEHTHRLLNKKQKFLCMEGGISREFYEHFSEYRAGSKKEETVLMYAGILEQVTGVDMLLEAFEQLEDDRLRLLISGRGSLEESVMKASQGDQRIQYLGCPEYEVYMENLARADILVNPRNMQLPENRNNFPSKVMEYLATGKPVISTRFAGWQKFETNFYFCDSTAQDIGIAITTQTKNRERDERKFHENRTLAQSFLWENQAVKILELLMET